MRDCNAFAITDDKFLAEGEQIFSATGYQRNSLNRLSSREPVVAEGTIRSVSTGFFGGPPFYYGEIDLDEGGINAAPFVECLGRVEPVRKVWTGPAFHFPPDPAGSQHAVMITPANAAVLSPYLDEWSGDVSPHIPMLAVLVQGAFALAERAIAGAASASVASRTDRGERLRIPRPP